jgi:hypothetical protein
MEYARNNYLLGLTAIAGPYDGHLGPFILAMEFLRNSLGGSDADKSGIDARIKAYAQSQKIVIETGGELVLTEYAKDEIEAVLEHTCGQLHFVAHDAIIGAYALGAIEKLHPSVPRVMVDGICSAIQTFNGAPPGIFFDYDDEEIRAIEKTMDVDSNLKPADLVRRMKAFLESVSRTYLGFGFRVQEYHAITHTHALAWFYRNDFHRLYRIALKPWLLRMHLIEKIKEPRVAGLRIASHQPIKIGSPEFWERARDGAGDLHLFKASHALIDLLEQGLLTRLEVDAIVDSKFGRLFSKHENEFIGFQAN